MGKGEVTRAAIISEALSQAVVGGLEGLTLGVLASSLKLSKSGLFAHFKSKEALQLAVLETAIDRFTRKVVVPALSKAEGVARLEMLFGNYLDWIRRGDGSGGCLFVTVAQEVDDRPGPVRDLLVESQTKWRGVLGQCVADTVKAKTFRADADPNQIVFEMVGIALSFQHSLKLFGDKRARLLAEQAFARLIDDNRVLQ
ncbi:transcriptional regulator, TetR family [Rhizobiales bacterium GAS191]|nr:transcriptional regulator, TetR family [Rhizobiales bacterium GAS188]SEE29925.1 transcriptional regulator, TetR family [Rhizobiales bacterium GAS191]